MRREAAIGALAALPIVAGGTPRIATGQALRVPCIGGGLARELRDRIAELLSSTDRDEQALVDSLGLRPVARQRPRVVRDAGRCDRAARAYAGAGRVAPVAVVQVGDRLIVLSPMRPATSEWSFVRVFDREFESLGSFTY